MELVADDVVATTEMADAIALARERLAAKFGDVRGACGGDEREVRSGD
jgi:hypothetical protein